MTDRELLELAAKAVGLRISNRLTDGGLMVMSKTRPSPHKWNSLVNGQDTLYLINALNLTVRVEDLGYTLAESEKFCADEYNLEDKDRALKRAVTRVAAEIGAQL